MKRYDLRPLKEDCLGKMEEIIQKASKDEVMIFLFEVGNFSNVKKSALLVNSLNSTLLNSLKFNQVDWTIVVKKG